MTFKEAIEKINNMIQKHFDAKVQFIEAHTSQPAEIVYFETVRRNSGAPLIVTHNNMLLPVRVEGSLVGAIRVSEISSLNHVDLCRIKETIDLVLEEDLMAPSLPIPSELEEIESKVLPFRALANRLATAN